METRVLIPLGAAQQVWQLWQVSDAAQKVVGQRLISWGVRARLGRCSLRATGSPRSLSLRLRRHCEPAFMYADICHDDDDLSRWKPGLSIRGVHRLKTQILTRDVRRRKLVGATAVRTRLRRLSHFSEYNWLAQFHDQRPESKRLFSLNYQDRGSRPGSPTDCDGTTSPELAQQPDRAQVQIVREGWASLGE